MPPHAKTVEFWFDVGSPAAYIAWTQMPALAAATGARIEYRPMLLGGVFQATGNHSPMTIAPKASYMVEDLQRYARRYAIPFRHNPFFPINTLMLMRGAMGLRMREPERMVPYADAVVRAIWVDGRNMNDPGVVAGVLEAAGFDAQALFALTQDTQVKERLKQDTQQAVERGVFGAPTFFVDGQMYWGQDRLEFVKEALA
jgi:2-hydroxychromene-2-carboxylate isomerase